MASTYFGLIIRLGTTISSIFQDSIDFSNCFGASCLRDLGNLSRMGVFMCVVFLVWHVQMQSQNRAHAGSRVQVAGARAGARRGGAAFGPAVSCASVICLVEVDSLAPRVVPRRGKWPNCYPSIKLSRNLMLWYEHLWDKSQHYVVSRSMMAKL